MNNSFCSKAFNGISITPSGGCAPCCLFERVIHKSDGTPFKIWEDDLESIYHSEAMKTIREKMLAGVKIDACRQCYQVEAYGGYSLRQQSNTSEIARPEEIAPDAKNLPRFVDLKLNNRCNVKCRMCQPRDSHLIFNEFKKIGETTPEFQNFSNTALTDIDLRIPLDEVTDWSRSPVFRESFRRLVPGLTILSLVGGEPLILDETYELLEMIAEGAPGKVQINLTTNLVHLPFDRLAKLLPFARWTLFNISLDAVEDELFYLRYPTSFEKVKANFHLLQNLPGQNRLQFSPTAQVYNVLSLDKVYRFVESLMVDGDHFSKTPVNLKFLEFPVHLNVRILPRSVREVAIKKLKDLKADIPRLMKIPVVAMNLEQLIQILDKESITHHDYLPEFLYYSDVLDRERGQSGPKAFPELFELLKGVSPKAPIESYHTTRERGWRFAQEGKLEDAVLEFKKALESSSNKDLDLREMAWMKLTLGFSKEALDLYQRAYEINPDDPFVLKGLALMYHSNKDESGLAKILHSALRKNPGDSELMAINSRKN